MKAFNFFIRPRSGFEFISTSIVGEQLKPDEWTEVSVSSNAQTFSISDLEKALNYFQEHDMLQWSTTHP